MPHDPKTITPSGKTYAEIEADQTRYVIEANAILASLRQYGCRWWDYSVSHRTFKLIVGDALARTPNVLVVLSACDHISGPVSWPAQQLRVIFEIDRKQDQAWLFILQDDSVQFKAVAGAFGWRKDFDLLAPSSPTQPELVIDPQE